MRYLTAKGILLFFYIITVIIMLLSLQGCSSLAPCGNLSDEEFRKCHDQNEAQRAHNEMVRSGYYDR
jgi:hypothetical protein